MGTSTSSSGGKAGSPFDPAWLQGPDGTADAGNGEAESPGNAEAGDGEDAAAGESVSPENAEGGDGVAASGDAAPDADFAPSRRFADARTKMAGFLSGGDRDALRAATKSMVGKGMGGPVRASSTMRRTAQGAGQLAQFLAAARDGTDPRVVDWVARVREANLSANDLILELVKEVLPDTGSVDDESLRNAQAEALGQLFEANPDTDIFALTDTQINDVMAFTIANEVCNRMDLQLGQTYERLKFDAREIQLYRNDVREYVRSEVSVVMQREAAKGLDPQRLARAVLDSALKVFAQ